MKYFISTVCVSKIKNQYSFWRTIVVSAPLSFNVSAFGLFSTGGKIPQDRTVIRRVLRTLSIPLLICMWVVTTVGIVVAVSLIIFNVLNHHRRYVVPIRI